MTRSRRPQGGRPSGIEIRNREQLRHDLSRLGDRATLARLLQQAVEEDEQRSARRYPNLPQARTLWEWLDRGKPVAWPGHGLRDLAQFIRDQTGKPCDGEAWTQLPAAAMHVCNAPRRPAQSFRGRDAELSELRELLGGEQGAAASIEGLPGLGKTELALNLTHGLAAEIGSARGVRFPRGIFWLNAETRDLTAQWDQIARSCLDIQGEDVAQRVGEAIRRIERSPELSLLVLDNAWLGKDERWEDGHGKPSPLPEGPQVRLLVTTRNDYFGGSAFRQMRLGVLPEADSRELLLEGSHRDPQRDAARLDGLDALLEQLAGHALAVEISGVYLQKNPGETPRSLLRRIAQGQSFERLARQTGYAVQKSERDATIQGAFTALWSSLEAETRDWWRLAAQFEAAPVSAELSEAVGLSRAALEALRDFHLIDWDADGSRWVMHRLIRAFGREHPTPEERTAARRAWVVGSARHASRIDAAAVLGAYLGDRAHFDAALIAAPELLSLDSELDFLLSMGPALMAHRGYTPDDARRLYVRAVDAAERAGHDPQVFLALDGLWNNCSLKANWERAPEIIGRVEELARVHDSAQYRLAAHTFAVQHLLFIGQLEPARERFEAGLPLARVSDPAWPRTNFDLGATLLAHGALARCLLGAPDQGLRYMREATELALERQALPSVAMALAIGSTLHQFRGEVDEVEIQGQRLMALGKEHALPLFLNLGAVVAFWARIARDGDADPGALAAMRESAEQLAKFGFDATQSLYCGWMADACRRLGRRSEGLGWLDDAQRNVEKTDVRFVEPELWRLRAALVESRPEAVRCLERAIEIATRQGSRWWGLRAALDLLELADTPEARVRTEQTLGKFYSGFSDGFELPELRRARAVLGLSG